jgi:hypothetical protein
MVSSLDFAAKPRRLRNDQKESLSRRCFLPPFTIGLPRFGQPGLGQLYKNYGMGDLMFFDLNQIVVIVQSMCPVHVKTCPRDGSSSRTVTVSVFITTLQR